MEKKLHLKLVVAMFIAFSLLSLNSKAQQDKNKTAKKISKWYRGREWLNGLQIKPHSSIDEKEFARQYHANKVWWDKAFEYMKDTDLTNMMPGTYPIDGKNVYAIITQGPGKEFEQGKWESHRHYNDIQYIITGKEKIGVEPITSVTVIEPYDDSKDIAFYTGEGDYYTADPGMFFIFFPKNAHRPGIKVNGDEPIKKIVIKVRTGE